MGFRGGYYPNKGESYGKSLEITWKLGYTVVYKASGFPKLGVPVLEYGMLGSILGLPISEN